MTEDWLDGDPFDNAVYLCLWPLEDSASGAEFGEPYMPLGRGVSTAMRDALYAWRAANLMEPTVMPMGSDIEMGEVPRNASIRLDIHGKHA